MKIYNNFRSAITAAHNAILLTSHEVLPGRWQGVDLSMAPEARMQEVLNYSFQVVLAKNQGLDYYRQDIEPNLPWADEHFEKERVSGHPINPGETWKIWPYGHSADKFRDDRGQYNHSYAERYWPKWAGISRTGQLEGYPGPVDQQFLREDREVNRGIRYEYGDLNDLVDHLASDPNTRQAYLPVWFPEDGSHNDRKPCTLGYHFIHRMGFLHVVYYIRSCDLVRHFQDDIYLTVRLLLWVLDELCKKDSKWGAVRPGVYTMHITSLHCFVNDYRRLKEAKV